MGNVQITVSGSCGVGKTVIGLAIEAYLTELGLEVEFKGLQRDLEPDAADVPRIISNILEKDDPTKVTIVEVTTARHGLGLSGGK